MRRHLLYALASVLLGIGCPADCPFKEARIALCVQQQITLRDTFQLGESSLV